MSLSAQSYPVRRSAGVCVATGRAFAPGEPIVAALIERADGGLADLERADFSADAWRDGARPAPGSRAFAVWRTTYRPNEAARNPILGDAELLELFEELGSGGPAGPLGDDVPTDAGGKRQLVFRYVLALLLIRRRMLRMLGTRRLNGGSVLLVIPRGADASNPIEVVDPGMDDAAVQDAIDQLGRIIDTDAPPAGPSVVAESKG